MASVIYSHTRNIYGLYARIEINIKNQCLLFIYHQF